METAPKQFCSRCDVRAPPLSPLPIPLRWSNLADTAGHRLRVPAAQTTSSSIGSARFPTSKFHADTWRNIDEPAPFIFWCNSRYASRGPATLGFRFDELVWQGKAALPAGATCLIKNVWDTNGTLSSAGSVSGSFSAPVAANDVVFVILHSCT